MWWLRVQGKRLSLKHRVVLLPQVVLLLRLPPTGVPRSLPLPSVVVLLRRLLLPRRFLLRLLRLPMWFLLWLPWRFLLLLRKFLLPLWRFLRLLLLRMPWFLSLLLRLLRLSPHTFAAPGLCANQLCPERPLKLFVPKLLRQRQFLDPWL
jgi:hypothetical protein